MYNCMCVNIVLLHAVTIASFN